MPTGYDSYWMYQNNKPEPLLDLYKNDQYNYGVVTDNNTHVQSGKPPSLFSICTQPENSYAYHHQNSQYRRDFHQAWPSSAYFNPPNDIYLSRRGFVNWSNNTGYSPNNYYQQNSNIRCSNNFNQISNNGCVSRPPSKKSKSASGQVSRIRVKDVYSLNNSAISDPLLNNNLIQTQSKQPNRLNYASNNCSTAPQTKVIESRQLPHSNQSSSYFAPVASKECQQSNSCCNKNGKDPPPYRECIKSSGVIVSKSSVHLSQEKRSSAVDQKEKIQEAHTKSCSVPQESEKGNILQRKSVIERPKKNNSDHLGSVQTFSQMMCGMSNPSSVPHSTNSPQNDTENGSVHYLGSPKTSTANLLNQKTSNQENSSQQVQREENGYVQISIPLTSGSFIRLNDINTTCNSSCLSLPCLLESNNKQFRSVTRDNFPNKNINACESTNLSVVQTTPTEITKNGFSNSDESYQNLTKTNDFISFRKNVPSPKECFISFDEESVKNFISDSSSERENLSSEFGTKNVLDESVPENKTLLRRLLNREHSNPNLSVSDPGVRENLELNKIKTEETSFEETHEDPSTQISENSNSLKEFPVEMEVTQNVDSTAKEVSSKKPETKTKSVKKSENRTREGEKSMKKTHFHKKKYKSKINRVKLDMLIQFLEKDDDYLSEKVESDISKSKNGVDEKQGRRKLSKSCIVKNKNISREMVSLMTHKTSRMDLHKNSSEPPKIVQSNTKSVKVEEGKESSAESCTKQVENENSRSLVEEEQRRIDLSQSEQSNTGEPVVEEVEERTNEHPPEKDDKTLIKTLKALRSMRTSFCASCSLNLSVDSFWVNVVSFELKCLNCFKKSFLEEIKSEKSGWESEKIESRSPEDEKTGEEGNVDGKDLKDVDKSKCFSKSLKNSLVLRKIKQENSGGQSVKNNLEEENVVLKTKFSEDCSTTERESLGKSRKEPPGKEDVTERTEKPEENFSVSKLKRKSSLKENCFSPKQKIHSGEKSNRKSTSKEESEERKSISKEQDVGSTQFTDDLSKRRSTSKEREKAEDVAKKEKKGIDVTPKRKSSTESASEKIGISEERAKKEGKKQTESLEKPTKKIKESFHKKRTTELQKISKQPEKSEVPQIPSKECCSSHKSKSTEQSKQISCNETKSHLTSNDLEGQKSRKRKHLDAEQKVPRKVCVLELHTKKEVQVSHSEKTKPEISSKDSNQRNKSNSEKQISCSTDRSKPKDVICQKIKSWNDKHKIDDSVNSPRRKSREESSHSKEQSGDEIKHKNKKQMEEKEKPFVGKIPKISNSDEDYNAKSTENVGRPQKPTVESKPLKENQNNKLSTTINKLQNKECIEDAVKSKEKKEKKKDKKTKKVKSQVDAHTNDVEFVNGNTKTKIVERQGENQRENCCNKDLNKLIERSITVKKEDSTSPDVRGSSDGKQSATLLEKLIRKTKKLSWGLLGEA